LAPVWPRASQINGNSLYLQLYAENLLLGCPGFTLYLLKMIYASPTETFANFRSFRKPHNSPNCHITL